MISFLPVSLSSPLVIVLAVFLNKEVVIINHNFKVSRTKGKFLAFSKRRVHDSHPSSSPMILSSVTKFLSQNH